MDDRVSGEAKLTATKEIVMAYVKSAVLKEGENQRQTLTPEEICAVFKKIYGTIDETLPSTSKKIGLGV